MRVTFIQTSDPFVYYPMLQETSKTIRHFCLANGFGYEQYVGVKRGHMLWQSTYNRVHMLKEMLDRGVEGWVFYLDADAFIIDLRFDLVGYLGDKGHYGAIFAGYITEIYDVNAGGFAVNLSHPAGKALILEWHRRCENLLAEGYDRALSWDYDVLNDQAVLFLMLKEWYQDRRFGDAFLVEYANRSYVNNGPFITQQIRAFHPTFDARVEAIRARVAEVMADCPPLHAERGIGRYATASHPRLRTECGDKQDGGIFTTANPGAFLRGPNTHVEPGSHVLRIFGRAEGPVPASEVVAQGGSLCLSAASRVAPAGDLLAEHAFHVDERIYDLEVRMDVTAEHRLCVHAVQIVP